MNGIDIPTKRSGGSAGATGAFTMRRLSTALLMSVAWFALSPALAPAPRAEGTRDDPARAWPGAAQSAPAELAPGAKTAILAAPRRKTAPRRPEDQLLHLPALPDITVFVPTTPITLPPPDVVEGLAPELRGPAPRAATLVRTPPDPETTAALPDAPPAPTARPPLPHLASQPAPDFPAAPAQPASAPAPTVVPPEPTAPPAIAVEPALEAGKIIQAWAAERRKASKLPDREVEAIAGYYASRGNAPLWRDGNDWSKAGQAIAARLTKSGEDALPSARYARSPVAAAPAREAALRADLALSESALLYARDAQGGRVNPARLSALITPDIVMPDTAAVLAALTSAPDADAVLQGFNPPQPGYRALRAKLAEARTAMATTPPVTRIPPGVTLRIGSRDTRVPLLRTRLNLPAADDTTYDAALAEAVTAFQRGAGLPATGLLTRATTAALSGEGEGRPAGEAEIAANMERWRWLPRDLGQRYVMVNIPEFELRLVSGGAVAHQARVVVGKPTSPTPVFSHPMEYLVVNPSWNVPPSILKNEFLPKMAQDPDFAAKLGYEVIRHGDSIAIRQPPGERNALGHIKFMFPNRHAVYIHDTPSRSLFANAVRAYSHGCVRVQDPFRLGEIVLTREAGWSEARLKGMIGSSERTVRLAQPLPVHIVYFTAFVNDGGRLESRADLYGYDARLTAALASAS